MANGVKKRKAKIYYGDFPLSNEPAGVQLTVHMNNIIQWQITKGFKKEHALEVIKTHLDYPNRRPWKGSVGRRVKDLCNFYGRDYVKSWCSEVYGWNYEDVA